MRITKIVREDKIYGFAGCLYVALFCCSCSMEGRVKSGTAWDLEDSKKEVDADSSRRILPENYVNYPHSERDENFPDVGSCGQKKESVKRPVKITIDLCRNHRSNKEHGHPIDWYVRFPKIDQTWYRFEYRIPTHDQGSKTWKGAWHDSFHVQPNTVGLSMRYYAGSCDLPDSEVIKFLRKAFFELEVFIHDRETKKVKRFVFEHPRAIVHREPYALAAESKGKFSGAKGALSIYFHLGNGLTGICLGTEGTKREDWRGSSSEKSYEEYMRDVWGSETED